MKARSVRNLLDLALVTSQQVHMGDVVDVMVDPAEQRAIKLGVDWVMDNRQVSGPDRDLPFNQIMTFDPHQVVVSDEIGETAGLDLLNATPEGLVSVADDLFDHDVVTQGGERLGSLVDVFVDEEDGAILGYEITNEEIETEHRRTRILAPTSDMELRDGEIIVPDRLPAVSVSDLLQDLNQRDEEEIGPDYAEADVVRSARIQDPDTDENLQDPNDFPGGHRVGQDAENIDSYLG